MRNHLNLFGRSGDRTAAGLSQHSHSWLQSSQDPWPRFLFFPRHARVSKWGFHFDEGGVGLCRRHVCDTVVSARVYLRCHGVQVTMDCVHPLSLHCAKLHLYKTYRGFLSTKACASGYALSYVTTLKLQLVSWTLVGLTAAKFKPLIHLMTGFSLSNTMYIWICLVYDSFCLCPVTCSYIVIHLRNFDSHMQFADWCALVKISNSAEYSVLQALQFQAANVRRIHPGGTGISHNWLNHSFVITLVNVKLRQTVSRPVYLVVKPHLGPKTRFLLLSRQFRVCWCKAPSLTRGRICRLQLLLTRTRAVILGFTVPRDSWPYFTVSDSKLPQPGGPGPRIYISQEQGGPVIPPGTGFPFRRLLRLARLRWRYSNPLPHGLMAENIFSLRKQRRGPWKRVYRPLPSNGCFF
jgi:hypothetical protein